MCVCVCVCVYYIYLRIYIYIYYLGKDLKTYRMLNFSNETQKSGSNLAGWHNSSLSNTTSGSSAFSNNYFRFQAARRVEDVEDLDEHGVNPKPLTLDGDRDIDRQRPFIYTDR